MSLLRMFSPPPIQSRAAGRPVFAHGVELQRRAADVEQERGLRTRRGGPRTARGRRDRATAPPPDGAAPRSLRARSQRELQLDQREVGVLQRHDADAHQPVVVGAELAHRPVVGPRGAVADLGATASGSARTAWRRCAWRTRAACGIRACRAPPNGRRGRTRRAPGSPSTARSAGRRARSAPRRVRRCVACRWRRSARPPRRSPATRRS